MKNKPMLAIFLTVLLGFIGISLPFPIFAHLILESNTFIEGGASMDYRHIMLGVTLSVYPFGQFLGAPILGQLSDRFGRKKLLTSSLVGTCICHFATAFFLTFHSFAGLLIARFACGLMEGNIAIAQSAAADLGRGSTEKKTKNFSLINSASYLGFLFGPIIGGFFGDPSLGFPYFIPFLIAGAFSICTLGVIVLFFEDVVSPVKDTKVHFFKGIVNLCKCWKTPKLNFFYLINFLLFVSMYFYFQFYSPFSVRKFYFSPFWVALLSAYLSIAMTLSQTFIVGRVSKRFSPQKAIFFSALGVAFSLILTSLIDNPWLLFLTVPIAAIFFAITMTNITVLISNSAKDELQGEAMGVTQSTQLLGEGVVCLIGGYISSIFIEAPFVLGSIVAIFAGYLVYRFLISKREDS